MSFVKVNLKNVPIVLFILAFALVLLLITVGKFLPSFVELCCVVILMIIAVSCFALLFRPSIIFPNISDERYRVNYLLMQMCSSFMSLLLAIYSSSVQSFHMHLLSSLALLISILAFSLLPVVRCYKKYALSLRDLLIGLRLVITTSERAVNYILGKLVFWFIILMPSSIIISYLIAEARITVIPFSTLVLLISYIAVVIVVSVEMWHEFPKSFLTFIFLIFILYWYILLTSAISDRKLLEYNPDTLFYNAVATLGFLFFYMSIVASTKCRNEAATSV